MVLASGTNTSDISLYFHELCPSALRSSVTLPILDLINTLRLCLRLQSVVNIGPGMLIIIDKDAITSFKEVLRCVTNYRQRYRNQL
jgi:hypothetical protein